MTGSILQFLAFWAFISLHFGLVGLHVGSPPFVFFHFGFLGLHFLSFWLFGLSFPFLLAFWAFISFYIGILGLHFLSFWPFGPLFPFILAFLGLYFLSFWLFGPLFPCILAFWGFISFHFRRFPLVFSFSCQGRGFPYLLVFWWRSLQLCLLTLVSTGLTALPAMDAQAHACETSGTASPSPPQWWEDAAGVSHAPAPVLHREGLFGRTPTD